MPSPTSLRLAVFLSLLSSACYTLASPDASTQIQLCTEPSGSGTAGTCITLPIPTDFCISLQGGLTFLDKQVQQATIPGGLVCTFYETYDCLSTGREIVLQGGLWNFNNVPGPNGTPVSYADIASSFSCSAL